MSFEQPLVSVIMPAYNAEKYIVESVESIINQTYQEWELIIINDGSSDKTGSLIKELIVRDSRIISLENDGNKGIVYTRNRGLKEAKGKYIANLDSDDVAYPERIETQIKFLEENDSVVLLGSACEIIDSEGNLIGTENRTIPSEQIKSLLVFSNYFINSTVVVKKALIQDCAYVDNYAPAEDYQFFTQIKSKGELANLSEVLVKYRVHENNISSIKKEQQETAIKRIHKNLLLELGIDCSKEELELHFNLVNENEFLTEVKLAEIELWLLTLQSLNYKVKRYNENAFNHFCAFFYRRACQKTNLGLKSILKYRKSKLSPFLKGDFKGNSIFYLKGMLKIK